MGLRGRPVHIKSAEAYFDQVNRRLAFSGGAVAEQGQDVMSGDSLTGVLNEQKRLKQIETRGNSYLRSANEGRAAEAFAVNMDFYFDGNQKLERANATENVRARTLDADAEAQVETPTGWVEIGFAVQGERSLLKEVRDGRALRPHAGGAEVEGRRPEGRQQASDGGRRPPLLAGDGARP